MREAMWPADCVFADWAPGGPEPVRGVINTLDPACFDRCKFHNNTDARAGEPRGAEAAAVVLSSEATPVKLTRCSFTGLQPTHTLYNADPDLAERVFFTDTPLPVGNSGGPQTQSRSAHTAGDQFLTHDDARMLQIRQVRAPHSPRMHGAGRTPACIYAAVA
jgi:hypothetical protein